MFLKQGKFLIPIVIVLLIFTSGCEKWRDNREVVTSSDHMLAESIFHEMSRYVLLMNSSAGLIIADTCVSVTFSDTTYPYVITIDFGSASCPGFFEAELQGQVTAAVSGPRENVGSSISIILDNVSVDGYEALGTINILSKGSNAAGNLEYGYKVVDGVITLIGTKEGDKVSWNCDYNWELKETGSQPGFVLDDLYIISGSASGVNREGKRFTAAIEGSLQKEIACRWNRSGIVKITPDDLKERTVDFGGENCSETSGCCDNLASVEIGRKTYNLNMR